MVEHWCKSRPKHWQNRQSQRLCRQKQRQGGRGRAGRREKADEGRRQRQRQRGRGQAHILYIRIFPNALLNTMCFGIRISRVHSRVLVVLVVRGSVVSSLGLRGTLLSCTQTRKAESCNDHVTCRTSERVRERGTARQAGARLNPYRQRTTEAFPRWKALHLHTASRQSCEEKW